MERWLSPDWSGDDALAADFFRGDRRTDGAAAGDCRVSPRRRFSFPVWLFTYVFRGTPLYVQLLVFYSGVYSLEIVRGTDLLNAFFRSGLNCAILALALNTCAYTTEIFAGQFAPYRMGKLKPPEHTVFPVLSSTAVLFCQVRCVLHCQPTATK